MMRVAFATKSLNRVAISESAVVCMGMFSEKYLVRKVFAKAAHP